VSAISDDVTDRLTLVSCGILQLNDIVEVMTEDMTNTLLYMNELADKVNRVGVLVNQNSDMIEDQMEYLGELSLPNTADNQEILDKISFLNRSLNAWVGRSVMAYENQGRLSALAGAERRAMDRRIARIEVDVFALIASSQSLVGNFSNLEESLESLEVGFQELNSTSSKSCDCQMTPAVTSPTPPITTTTQATVAMTTKLASDDLDKLKENVNKNLLLLKSARTSIERINDKFTHLTSEGWYNAPNGYQYYLSTNAFRSDSFSRSRRYCQYRGGDLAHIGMRDEVVYRFLWNTVLSRARILCVWIGLTDMEVDGKWKWIDGKAESDSWSNWRRKQQGVTSPLQDCASIRAGIWQPSTCSGIRQQVCSFICERKTFH